MSLKRRKWLCLDCKIDTGKIGEYYFLKTEVWLSVVSSINGMLCIGCLEQRLKRTLTREDFTDCYLNLSTGNKSVRLLKRLGYGRK